MDKLQQLKRLLLTGVLLSEDSFTNNDADFILDGREMDVFDSEWIRNYNKIRKNENLKTPEVKELVDSIREISYKSTYKATQSSDLAGYISDDFGLIAEALLIDYNDNWVNALAYHYVEGKIPHSVLEPLKGQLYEIVLK
ncbi:hypothetical protein CSC2_20310 [Clostridium zeae]|uniref:Phage protein n=1 Tax=Clostridium zeae TaxID=2759022 RepID=A0ABQ1E9L7_9CLOT|nr:hypothetical protein [Clostridium zeae]GFZ31505.1 hypothetical protein CSC2_20310 [Clostridium zeae]